MTIKVPYRITLSEALKASLHTDFCICEDTTMSRADLLSHALALSEKLPAQGYAINLCQDRYLFIVAFLAVCIRDQITLLPSNQASKTLLDLKQTYPNSYILGENDAADFVVNYDLLEEKTAAFPTIDIDRIISISFTSGSTGSPKAVQKTWREFQTSAELALQQLNLQQTGPITLVSTVPMQHMYGLETSLFWVLFSQLTLHNSRPFYPEDIRHTINILPHEKILISTPRHLKSCSQTHSQWHTIKFILSSTAAMDAALAKQIEENLRAPVFELFGSTETLSFASRRATISTQWHLYTSIKLIQEQRQLILQGGHIVKPYILDDIFEIHDAKHFTLLGRSTDLIKIAGKRASLSELNQLLLQISGIEDGIFFPSKNERLSAIVVSQLPKQTIINHLKQCIDEVFFPRAIYTVPALPRNDMGKLIKTDIEQLIRKQQLGRK